MELRELDSILNDAFKSYEEEATDKKLFVRENLLSKINRFKVTGAQIYSYLETYKDGLPAIQDKVLETIGPTARRWTKEGALSTVLFLGNFGFYLEFLGGNHPPELKAIIAENKQ